MRIPSVLLTLALLSGCHAAPPETRPAAPLAGGWSAASVAEADVLDAAKAAAGATGVAGAALGAVETAERQVVAGTNYRLVFTLADRSRWRAVVWRRLDGTLQVTEHARAP